MALQAPLFVIKGDFCRQFPSSYGYQSRCCSCCIFADLLCQRAEAKVCELGLQVINRAKLERAGKDNAFVKLLYGKDRARTPQTIDEQHRIGGARHTQ
jgi:hypothetical protein